MKSTFKLLAATVIVAMLLSVSESKANILLNIDATDRTNVVFTPTGLTPLVDSSRMGFSLIFEDFFPANEANNFAVGMVGDLRSFSGVHYLFPFTSTGTDELMLGQANTIQTFDQSQPAFFGQSTADFTIFGPLRTNCDLSGYRTYRDRSCVEVWRMLR